MTVALDTFRVYTRGADPFAPDGYPLAWHNVIKDAVREQAGYRCVRCGHPYRKGAGEWSPCDHSCTHEGPLRTNGEPVHASGANVAVEIIAWLARRGTIPVDAYVEAQWRILTVHHLNGDKADCRWWNLAALCQRCHLTIQGRVVMARVWPWEHSDWFKPYVAGYYASVYLDEELDRDQVDARLDELLSLERAA